MKFVLIIEIMYLALKRSDLFVEIPCLLSWVYIYFLSFKSCISIYVLYVSIYSFISDFEFPVTKSFFILNNQKYTYFLKSEIILGPPISNYPALRTYLIIYTQESRELSFLMKYEDISLISIARILKTRVLALIRLTP